MRTSSTVSPGGQLHAAASGLQPFAGLATSRSRFLRPAHLHHKGRIHHHQHMQRVAHLEIDAQQPLGGNPLGKCRW